MNRTVGCWISLVLFAVVGCTPRVMVRPNPGPETPGIRYYRPKPYLLITPLVVERSKKDSAAITPFLADEFVTIELQYLPDFAEEYAIDIRAGLGTNKTEVTLKDGWNLTGLTTDLDAQADENIEAMAGLIRSIGSLPQLSAIERPAGNDDKVSAIVRATNVPLGFYEAVIGRDACGRKQLYGWRYVGFQPFNGCPTTVSGQESTQCNDFDTYGLVFDNGVMTFKQLGVIRQLDQSYAYQYQPVGRPEDVPAGTVEPLPQVESEPTVGGSQTGM
ncbi:MAG: hypothetical protein U0795_18165 [Pirellulales bacterium]